MLLVTYFFFFSNLKTYLTNFCKRYRWIDWLKFIGLIVRGTAIEFKFHHGFVCGLESTLIDYITNLCSAYRPLEANNLWKATCYHVQVCRRKLLEFVLRFRICWKTNAVISNNKKQNNSLSWNLRLFLSNRKSRF